LVGEQLRYVAECQGRWVALLSWSAAATTCSPSKAIRRESRRSHGPRRQPRWSGSPAR
jgi:hypothetical protein